MLLEGLCRDHVIEGYVYAGGVGSGRQMQQFWQREK